jgi:hypothetical protein
MEGLTRWKRGVKSGIYPQVFLSGFVGRVVFNDVARCRVVVGIKLFSNMKKLFFFH